MKNHIRTSYCILGIMTGFFLLFLLTSFTKSSETNRNLNSIQWISIEEAIEKNEKQARKIMVSISTSWCVACKEMDASTYQNRELTSYINENYYAVKFDAEAKEPIELNGTIYELNANIGSNGVHGLALYLANGKTVYPTIAILDETMNNPQAIFGFQGADELQLVLSYFGEDYYKSMEWEVFLQTQQTAKTKTEDQ